MNREERLKTHKKRHFPYIPKQGHLAKAVVLFTPNLNTTKRKQWQTICEEKAALSKQAGPLVKKKKKLGKMFWK